MPNPRPITTDTLAAAAAELRRQAADETVDFVDIVDPETATFVADLLEMPLGHFLAHAELAGQRRAREIGDVVSECDDGTCPITSAVTEALLEVGPWQEIDGDGDVASVLADRVRELGRWYALGRRLVDGLRAGSFVPGPEAVVDVVEVRAELADLFDAIAEKRGPSATVAVVTPAGEARIYGPGTIELTLGDGTGQALPPFDPANPGPHEFVPTAPSVLELVDHVGTSRGWDGTVAGATAIIDWVLERGGTASFDDRTDGEWRIRVNVPPHGVLLVRPGDWLIDNGHAPGQGAEGRWTVKAAAPGGAQ